MKSSPSYNTVLRSRHSTEVFWARGLSRQLRGLALAHLKPLGFVNATTLCEIT